VHLIEEIGREADRKPIAPFELMAAMDAKFRLLGWQGLVGMAYRPRHGLLGRVLARPARPWLNCSAARRSRSRPMTATAPSIPADERICAAARTGFAASRSRAATATPP
jgi:hypothetical protein